VPVGSTVAVDMNTSGNSSGAVGTIEKCVATTAGQTITFDVVMNGFPSGMANIGGFNFEIAPASAAGTGNLTNLQVTARSNTTAGVNILANQGTGLIFDLSTTPPAALAGFQIAVSDFGPAEAPPLTTMGVLTRFTVSTTSVATGVYAFTIEAGLGFQMFDTNGFPAFVPDLLLDGEDGYGLIAVGTTCPPAASADADGDGFTDSQEAFMGTDAQAACPTTANRNDEHPDAWPPDGDDDGDADMGDVSKLMLGVILNPAAYQPRSDFNSSGSVDVGDLIAGFKSALLTTCG
jgi:hypothetical protein